MEPMARRAGQSRRGGGLGRRRDRPRRRRGHGLARARRGGAAGGSVKAVILTAVWVVPGVLITRARPGSVLGWLALGEAVLFAAAGLGDQWIRRPGEGSDDAGVAWAVWVTDRFSAFLAVGVWLVLILLPDGRLPSPRWRPVVGAIVAVQCLALAAFATVRGPAAGPDTSVPAAGAGRRQPRGPAAERRRVVARGPGHGPAPGAARALPVAYAVRLRRAGPDERVRVVGVLLAASTFVLLVVLGHAFWPQAAETLDVVAGALLAAQLTATVLGRRPRTVAVVVRQTFVHTRAAGDGRRSRGPGGDGAPAAGPQPARLRHRRDRRRRRPRGPSRARRGWPRWSTACSTATCAIRTGRCSGWPSRPTPRPASTPSCRAWPPRSPRRCGCRGAGSRPAGTWTAGGSRSRGRTTARVDLVSGADADRDHHRRARAQAPERGAGPARRPRPARRGRRPGRAAHRRPAGRPAPAGGGARGGAAAAAAGPARRGGADAGRADDAARRGAPAGPVGPRRRGRPPRPAAGRRPPGPRHGAPHRARTPAAGAGRARAGRRAPPARRVPRPARAIPRRRAAAAARRRGGRRLPDRRRGAAQRRPARRQPRRWR